jgi:chromosome segregation ATPase
MNLVGKIFTVLILVMSFAFMAFTLMVHAAHKNWRDDVLGKQVKGGTSDGGQNAELKKVYTEKQALLDEKKRLEDQIVEEKDRYVRRLAALEQVKIELTKERDANAKTIKDKEDALGKLVDAVLSIHLTISSLHTESEALRTESKAAVAERQKTLEQVVLINDSLLNTVVERLRLEKLERELRAQLLRMPSVPNHN